MMIYSNYAQQIAQAKLNNASVVNFDKSSPAIQPVTSEKDTVTLSDKAVAMMNGHELKEIPPTYARPETAKSILGETGSLDTTNDENKTVIDDRFSKIMQNLLDQRLGVDRKKLEELDAMMEEIANDESMSPEAKEKALEKLAEMREKIIEEGREIKAMTEEVD
jgi:hypothetical protein